MKKNRTTLKIGDSVRVKEGMLCPDLEDLCIGSWQGRVSEIGEDDNGNDLICIRWDSITLKKYHHPLCDLEVINADPANDQPLNDYCVWFANR